MLKGIKPILAHPERNRDIIDEPEILHRLIEKGCLVQVTSGSLTGQFGGKIKTLTSQMIMSNWVDFIASDAHDAIRRPVALKEAYQVAVGLIGESAATKLMLETPQRVIAGEPIIKGEVQSLLLKSQDRQGFWTGFKKLFSR